ncbi:MAG: chemotaxis protein CheW [Cytophagales bacterium]|nr:chemotaxis protein CheW [Cytophagales bacterium]
MVKKDTLSQFQSRLAGLLQSANQGGGGVAAANWLAVEIAGHGFILPLSQLGEIFPWAEPHLVPHAKDWFLGVVNLRGALCGVVSFEQYFGLKSTQNQSDQDAMKTISQHQRLVGFHHSLELNTVVVIDKLVGLKSKDQMKPTDLDHQYQDSQGLIWREVDLHLLSQDSSFLNIAK